MPLIEVSNGEVVDRATIAQIKFERLTDPRKERMAWEENLRLTTTMKMFGVDDHHSLYQELLRLNTEIWDFIDQQAKAIENGTTYTPEYRGLSVAVFETNNARFRVKALIDQETGSHIQEVKEHVDV